jgi:hypothetical protein
MTVTDPRLAPSFPAASARSGWQRRGGELANHAEEITGRACELLGSEASEGTDRDPSRTAELISTLTWLCIERLREHPPKGAVSEQICHLVCDLQQLALEKAVIFVIQRRDGSHPPSPDGTRLPELRGAAETAMWPRRPATPRRVAEGDVFAAPARTTAPGERRGPKFTPVPGSARGDVRCRLPLRHHE